MGALVCRRGGSLMCAGQGASTELPPGPSLRARGAGVRAALSTASAVDDEQARRAVLLLLGKQLSWGTGPSVRSLLGWTTCRQPKSRVLLGDESERAVSAVGRRATATDKNGKSNGPRASAGGSGDVRFRPAYSFSVAMQSEEVSAMNAATPHTLRTRRPGTPAAEPNFNCLPDKRGALSPPGDRHARPRARPRPGTTRRA